MQAHYLRDNQEARRNRQVVPTPLFVSSDMTTAVQAADLCIYCVNWGFRLVDEGMTAAVRADIAAEYGPLLAHLCFVPHGCKPGTANGRGSIAYVTELDPRATKQNRSGDAKKEEAKLLGPPVGLPAAEPPVTLSTGDGEKSTQPENQA
jgi:hypothetical protein